MSTRVRWHVRQVVPVAYPRTRKFDGYTIEQIRGPRAGIDRGLYLIRTPDGLTRTAVLRGIESACQPHQVYRMRDRLELGTQLASFWPGKKHLPSTLTLRDGVGDFDEAVRFACQSARSELLATIPPTPETSDD